MFGLHFISSLPWSWKHINVRAGIREIVTQWVRIEVVIAAWKAVGLGFEARLPTVRERGACGGRQARQGWARQGWPPLACYVSTIAAAAQQLPAPHCHHLHQCHTDAISVGTVKSFLLLVYVDQSIWPQLLNDKCRLLLKQPPENIRKTLQEW